MATITQVHDGNNPNSLAGNVLTMNNAPELSAWTKAIRDKWIGRGLVLDFFGDQNADGNWIDGNADFLGLSVGDMQQVSSPQGFAALNNDPSGNAKIDLGDIDLASLLSVDNAITVYTQYSIASSALDFQRIIEKSDGGLGRNGFVWYLDVESSFFESVVVIDNDSANEMRSTVAAIDSPLSTWVRRGFIFDGLKTRDAVNNGFFIADGVVVDSDDYGGPTSAGTDTEPMALMNRPLGTRGLSGSMEWLVMFDQVLSDAHLLELHDDLDAVGRNITLINPGDLFHPVDAALSPAIDIDYLYGEEPVLFTATNLPTGLAIDGATGVITGTPTVPGEYSVQIDVEEL